MFSWDFSYVLQGVSILKTDRIGSDLVLETTPDSALAEAFYPNFLQNLSILGSQEDLQSEGIP